MNYYDRVQRQRGEIAKLTAEAGKLRERNAELERQHRIDVDFIARILGFPSRCKCQVPEQPEAGGR